MRTWSSQGTCINDPGTKTKEKGLNVEGVGEYSRGE